MLDSLLEPLLEISELLAFCEQSHIQPRVLLIDIGHSLLEFIDSLGKVSDFLFLGHFGHKVLGFLLQEHVVDVSEVTFQLLGDAYNFLFVLLAQLSKLCFVVIFLLCQQTFILLLLFDGLLLELLGDALLLLLCIFLHLLDLLLEFPLKFVSGIQ